MWRGRGEPREDGCLIVLFCCVGLFLCLHDGYECSINVLIGENTTKILFADSLNSL